jgi:hypothetical protein
MMLLGEIWPQVFMLPFSNMSLVTFLVELHYNDLV